jgi:hypothetical protein
MHNIDEVNIGSGVKQWGEMNADSNSVFEQDVKQFVSFLL